ncbi:MAG: cupin domain-containing protein [Chloroflexi bacterium]|nr:MAG: cupin domain-containing protein [Chloroflexota bacterium]TME45235.1 MAG: cupin domain-containing protein [Chloroflexota bacterium]
MVEKVNVLEKFSRFNEYWQPKVIGELNDSYIKAVKVKDTFVWHDHPNEDELFFVVSGRMQLKLRDGDVALGPGEFAIVPRGVEHCPASDEETLVLLLEPKSTVNTGEVRNERTVAKLERL